MKLLLLLAIPLTLVHAQQYKLELIPIPDSTGVIINGINSRGDVVGYYQTPGPGGLTTLIHGFLRQADGTFLPINYPGTNTNTNPRGISDSGVIVGSYNPTNSFDGQIGFTYQQGVYQPVMYQSFPTVLTGISTNNQIVGSATGNGGASVPFSLTLNGTFSLLPTVQNLETFPNAINSSGEIVGQIVSSGSGSESVGFLLGSSGTIHSFALSHSDFTTLSSVNDRGTALGFAITKSHPNGQYFTLSQQNVITLPAMAGMQSVFYTALNDSGALTGYFINTAEETIGFIATPIQ